MMSKKRVQEIKAKKIKDEVDEWESYEPKCTCLDTTEHYDAAMYACPIHGKKDAPATKE